LSGLLDPGADSGVGPDPINVTSGDPAAVLPTGVTLTDGIMGYNDGSAGQGMFTGETHFTVTLNTPGSQTLTFVDAANPSAANGLSIVVVPFSPPSIVAQPLPSQTVNPGANAVFWVAAQGAPPLGYQWSFNGTPIGGATKSVLTIPSVTVAAAGQYSVSVTNPYGTVASNPCALTLGTGGSAPAITQQPSDQTVNDNSTIVLSVGASVGGSSTSAIGVSQPTRSIATLGKSPPARVASAGTFQWFLNGVAISGATGPTYVINSATPDDAGSYFCLVTNSAGSQSSNAVSVNVVGSSNPGRLTNLSCRSTVGSGANAMIVGFVLGGRGTSLNKSVLLRASGPALSQFNVSGLLPDPELTLNTAAGVVASNRGWGGSPMVSTAVSGVGAFAWNSTTSNDSALFESLAPGAYTAEVSGASGDTGIALAEIYDANSSRAYNPLLPHLVNFSSRVKVGTGGNILIAGFVVGCTTSKTVLIRASGPALTQFGVAGILPDPSLQLFRSNADGSSTLIGSNTGWGANSLIGSTASSVGAFSWGSAATPDSALVITLPPGSYTAQVSGASGDTGVALVEVYDVP